MFGSNMLMQRFYSMGYLAHLLRKLGCARASSCELPHDEKISFLYKSMRYTSR